MVMVTVTMELNDPLAFPPRPATDLLGLLVRKSDGLAIMRKVRYGVDTGFYIDTLGWADDNILSQTHTFVGWRY